MLFPFRMFSALALACGIAAADTYVFEGNIFQGVHQALNNGQPGDSARVNPNGRGRQTFRRMNLGLDFVVVADRILIDGLGVWDDNSDGLLSEHELSVFDITTGDLLASTVIAAGGGDLRGQYRYVGLDVPLVLAAGTEFTIVVGYGATNGDSNGNSGTSLQMLEPTPTFFDGGGAIAGIGRARAGTRGAGGRFGPGELPEILDTGPFNRYHSGSFRFQVFQPVSEPGIMIVVGLAVVGLAAWTRRRPLPGVAGGGRADRVLG
jgi:hypothetical protein